MSTDQSEARALRPLWLLTTGAAAGAICSSMTAVEPPPWMPPLLLVVGVATFLVALSWKRRARNELWLLAGLALASGRGLGNTPDRLLLHRAIASGDWTVRARVIVGEGWTDSRWGRRTRCRVIEAVHRETPLSMAGRCRVEIRGDVEDPGDLPPPGAEVDVLARVRGSPRSPLLVVASSRHLRPTGQRRWLPTFRDRLASSLLRAAGTNADRIRAAEMVAALSLGRRDLVPADRRDRWRRSGLAHLLAVSGLHVGLVAGSIWLILALSGLSPRSTRIAVLVAVPAYAVLAGAAPSAMRAALMAIIYLGARLLGRALLPMAAVLLAASLLVLARPGLIVDAGFQLTIVITAALVRWVPVLTETLWGPRLVTGAVAVPLIAQTAAAPLVGWHFRSLIPGAIIANLIALPLLAPTILGSVAAAVIAPLWAGAASLVLDLVGALLALIRFVSGPARSLEMVTPPIPAVVVLLLVAAGWTALQSGRRARFGVAAWLLVLLSLAVVWMLPAPTSAPTVELLTVYDGAAVLLRSGNDVVLADAGRSPREAARLLAAGGHRRLRAIVVSHTDEDHLGGVVQVVKSFRVGQLVVPVWMMADEQVVPLLRAARQRGVRVVPVTSGSAAGFGSIRLEVMWPPAFDLPLEENERSLVFRALFEPGSALLTADIGRFTEYRLVRSRRLRGEVLVVPHHGGRGSTSTRLLQAVAPSVALIPAAAGNTHGHPHAEVLERLSARKIAVRYPARDGRCGARWDGAKWVPFP